MASLTFENYQPLKEVDDVGNPLTAAGVEIQSHMDRAFLAAISDYRITKLGDEDRIIELQKTSKAMSDIDEKAKKDIPQAKKRDAADPLNLEEAAFKSEEDKGQKLKAMKDYFESRASYYVETKWGLKEGEQAYEDQDMEDFSDDWETLASEKSGSEQFKSESTQSEPEDTNNPEDPKPDPGAEKTEAEKLAERRARGLALLRAQGLTPEAVAARKVAFESTRPSREQATRDDIAQFEAARAESARLEAERAEKERLEYEGVQQQLAAAQLEREAQAAAANQAIQEQLAREAKAVRDVARAHIENLRQQEGAAPNKQQNARPENFLRYQESADARRRRLFDEEVALLEAERLVAARLRKEEVDCQSRQEIQRATLETRRKIAARPQVPPAVAASLRSNLQTVIGSARRAIAISAEEEAEMKAITEADRNFAAVARRAKYTDELGPLIYETEEEKVSESFGRVQTALYPRVLEPTSIMEDRGEDNAIMIAGFPGVGKTYFQKLYEDGLLPEAYDDFRFVECDIRAFKYINGNFRTRNAAFPGNYVEELRRLYAVPFTNGNLRNVVLFTSEREVDVLLGDLKYAVVYPIPNIQVEYLERWDKEVEDGLPWHAASPQTRAGLYSGAVPMSQEQFEFLSRNYDAALLNYSQNTMAWRFELLTGEYLFNVMPEILLGIKRTYPDARRPRRFEFDLCGRQGLYLLLAILVAIWAILYSTRDVMLELE